MKVKKLIACKDAKQCEVTNLAQFCKENGLSEATIKTIINKTCINTKGFTFSEVEVEVKAEVESNDKEGVQANEHTQEAEPKPKKRKSTVKKAEGQ